MQDDIAALLKAFWDGHLSPEALGNLRTWLTDEAFAEYRTEILAQVSAQAWGDLENGFYTTIPFGTGGRRGPRGPGPNRINRRTIAESARGLANWVIGQGEEAKLRGVVIAHDTRHGSKDFAQVSARAIAASGVTAYLFEDVRPTPELSFAVRHLRAKAGIVISASHNPPTDNGFKAYGEDGGQVLAPEDREIMEEVRRAGGGPIPLTDFEEGKARGIIRVIGREVDEAYLRALSGVTLTGSRGVRLVYTPLHGAGTWSVLPGLARAGFRDVHVVEEQRAPDGDFPNVENQIPNPEVPSALKQAMALAERVGADVALATDPDADRLGCAARRSSDGVWLSMTGNEIGAILCHFVLNELQRSGRLPPDGLVVKTAVTTDLINRIADHFGVGRVSELLVGFKYIGCVIRHLGDPDRFLFGLEESHGYLSRPYARDKDGANAALLLAEAAAGAREAGEDLWRVLDRIHRLHGYFSERLENYVRPGRAGQEEIGAMMRRLRERPPGAFAGMAVTRVVDRLTGEVRDPEGRVLGPFEGVRDPKTGAAIEALGQARDNLLIFHLAGGPAADGGKIAVRPSGTEPKCKFYVAAHRRVPEGGGDEALERVRREVDALIRDLRTDVLKKASEAG